MSSPENFGLNQDLPNEYDISMADLFQIEREEREEAFSKLYDEIQRLELLGEDDAYRMSYHKTYAGEGMQRDVYFGACMLKDVGRTFRVIVNDMWTDAFGEEQLRARDFMVAQDDRLISVSEDYRSRKPGREWPDMLELKAPWLTYLIRDSEERLVAVVGPNYQPIKPYNGNCSGIGYLTVMDRRIQAEELTNILRGLNETSQEEETTFEIDKQLRY